MRTVFLNCIVVLLTFAGHAANPLNEWNWRNPLPAGNSLYAITYAHGNFIAVGAGGGILASADGTNWSSRPAVTRNTLRGVTSSENIFVAVGEGGAIVTSPDGLAWTARSSGVTTHLLSVAYGNGRFAAVGESGVIVTSPDGVIWSRVPAVPNASLNSIAFGAGKFVVSGLPDAIITSSDGVSWANEPFRFAQRPTHHMRAHFGNGLFLILSQYSQQGTPIPGFVIFSSSNGTTWVTNNNALTFSYFISGPGTFLAPFLGTLYASSNGQVWTNVGAVNFPAQTLAGAFGNGTYVVIGPSGLLGTSVNARDWTNHLSGNLATLTGIASDGNISVATSANGLLVSINGMSYQPVPGITNALTSVAYGAGTFVAVGTSVIFKSTNGIDWVKRPSGTPRTLRGVTYGHFYFVAVGDGGAIQISDTGQIWTGLFSPVSYRLNAVAYTGGGSFVAVGELGTLLRCGLGWEWEVLDSGTLAELNGVAGNGSTHIAVGNSGIVATSTDTLTWQARTVAPDVTLRTITAGNGFFVMAGVSGDPFSINSPSALFSSIDGTTWTPRNPGALSGLYGSGFSGTRFTLVGLAGTILESGSTDLPLLFARIMGDDTCEVTVVGGTSGSIYHLERRGNFAETWETFSTFLHAGSSLKFIDTGTRERCFYRVRRRP